MLVRFSGYRLAGHKQLGLEINTVDRCGHGAKVQLSDASSAAMTSPGILSRQQEAATVETVGCSLHSRGSEANGALPNEHHRAGLLYEWP